MICKQCEVTAKGYAAFVDKIKTTQMKFRVPKLKKRPMPMVIPVITNNNTNNVIKRMKPGKDPIVGMIGECTVIRRVDIQSIPKQPLQPLRVIENNNNDVVDLDAEEGEVIGAFFDPGESSQSSLYNGVYTCKFCDEIFHHGKAFIDHLELCLPDAVCPICDCFFIAKDLLTVHLMWDHDFVSTFDETL